MDLSDIIARPIAHRGLHNRGNGVIENSRSAFARAIKGGYAIECDLQLTGDRVPMVFHDPDLVRLTGQNGRVATLSAGQMARIVLTDSAEYETPQTFAELLTQIDGAVPLVVELKQQENGRNRELAEAVAKIVADYEGPLVFKSFDPELVRQVKRAVPNRAAGIVTGRFDDATSRQRLSARQRFVLRHLLHKARSRFDFISCEHTALRLPAILMHRRSGMKVMSWTVRSYDEEDKARAHADQIVFEGFLPRLA